MNLALSLQQVFYKQCWKDWLLLFVFSINRPNAENFLDIKKLPISLKNFILWGWIWFLQIAKCDWESNMVTKEDDQVG